MADDSLCREKIISDDYYDLIIDFNVEDRFLEQLTGADVCNIWLPYRGHISYVNRAKVPQLAIGDYNYGMIPKLYGLLSCDALEASGILSVQQSTLQLTGRGIMIGFVDTGECVILLSVESDTVKKHKLLIKK
ncbi:hypothetical protein D7X88_00450 [bacterium C-53]|nr:hypothetical protein [Lachnospiraceae bacterium]NBI01489.1 hypothetical protein [Lachnospiraceae bacterium]RKJ12796.1 hypothetical protein D7X88_00450 [bacterium C-53]